MLRSLIFAVVFYLNTALFLACGSWLLLAPRSWAMQGLRLHGLASLWIPPVWAETLVYGAMLMVLVVRPAGLFSRIGDA